MTDQWFDKLFNQVGQDMWQAKIDRLLSEFQFLGEKNESRQRGECGQCNVIDGRDDIA